LLLVASPIYLVVGTPPSLGNEALFAAYVTRSNTIAITTKIVDVDYLVGFIVFAAGLCHLIRRVRPGDEWLAALAFGSALVQTTPRRQTHQPRPVERICAGSLRSCSPGPSLLWIAGTSSKTWGKFCCGWWAGRMPRSNNGRLPLVCKCIRPTKSCASLSELAASQASRLRREACYQEVVTLYQQGKSMAAIVERLHLSPTTVRKYVYAGAFPERATHFRRRGQLGSYLPYLERRVQEGCDNASLRLRGKFAIKGLAKATKSSIRGLA
jgi:hypothetical protein